jgi:hypothetical protein
MPENVYNRGQQVRKKMLILSQKKKEETMRRKFVGFNNIILFWKKLLCVRLGNYILVCYPGACTLKLFMAVIYTFS